MVHGPQPRSFEQRTPKKMKAAALRSALSDRARNGRIHVVSAFVEGDTPSTKAALGLLQTAIENRKALVVVSRDDVVSTKSVRNLPVAHVLTVEQLNTYDVMVADDVVFTESAITSFVGGGQEEEK